MMSSLRNLNSYRKSLAHKWNNKASRRSPYKPPTKIDLMKKHMKTHQYDGHVPNPNWHIQIHRGIEPAKNKIETMAKSYWYSFGNHRWTGHVPYPYYHPEIQKGVEITGRKVSKVLRDYWLDLSHDKWRYGIKQAIGVISGIVGYYTRTSAFGIISGPLFGYLMASVEHYIERRFAIEISRHFCLFKFDVFSFTFFEFTFSLKKFTFSSYFIILS